MENRINMCQFLKRNGTKDLEANFPKRLTCQNFILQVVSSGAKAGGSKKTMLMYSYMFEKDRYFLKRSTFPRQHF